MASRRSLVITVPLLVAIGAACAVRPARADTAAIGSRAAPAPATEDGPRWEKDGRLLFPAAYRGWVFLSSGLDMSYTEGPAEAHSEFDNVFVNRSAWEHFLRSGTWPDGTLLVLEVRAATGRGSINRRGRFQTPQVVALEVHVRDSTRLAGGWGFYSFKGEEPAAMLPRSEPCYACHEAHGAVDTTFVQFYPTLQAVAAAHQTLRPDPPP